MPFLPSVHVLGLLGRSLLVRRERTSTMQVTVKCDVCGGLVSGYISSTDGFTGGFYLRGWVVPYGKATQNDMFPEDKNIVCDYDMQSSAAYKKLYGEKAALAATLPPQRKARPGEFVRSYAELLAFIRGEWA